MREVRVNGIEDDIRFNQICVWSYGEEPSQTDSDPPLIIWGDENDYGLRIMQMYQITLFNASDIPGIRTTKGRGPYRNIGDIIVRIHASPTVRIV